MANTICENCEKVITGRVRWTEDGVALCEPCWRGLQAEEAERNQDDDAR